jgi:hypothetical protein
LGRIPIPWDHPRLGLPSLNVSIRGYITKSLHCFNHTTFKRPQHSPQAWIQPKYGRNQQLTTPHDESSPIDAPVTTKLQEIKGTLHFYGRAFDPTMLVALEILPPLKKEALRQQHRPYHSYSTTPPYIHMPPSSTTKATYSYMYTGMPLIC